MHLVVIGNSAAALAAVEEFRRIDGDSEVTMISKERGPAYSRVLLPYVLRRKVKPENVFIRDEAYYRSMGVELLCDEEVQEVNDLERFVRTRSGCRFSYDQLLIATGSDPVPPPIEGLQGEGVFHFWSLADLEGLSPLFNEKKRVLVIGSGFVSLQAAWAAASRGLSVTLAVRSQRLMRRVISVEGSDVLKDKILESGVDLRLGAVPKRVERLDGGGFRIYIQGEDPFDVDFVIVGIGVCPNVGFLKGTGVELDRGILVDRRMRTNVEGVYAAGDVAQGPTVFGEDHVIHALWPTAVEQGRVAGRNLAGREQDYPGSLNMNVTQMFRVTVASMGQFEEAEGLESTSLRTASGFLKVVFRGELPVGGVVVGSSEDVALLGYLRPFIRNGRPCPRDCSQLLKFFVMERTAARAGRPALSRRCISI